MFFIPVVIKVIVSNMILKKFVIKLEKRGVRKM